MATPVLLVDDERFARELYTDYLRQAGFEVDAASSAESAVERLAQKAYPCIVTDMVLPGSDGLQLLAEAKRRDPDVGVVVITALDLVEPAVRAMRAGAADYLVKPVTPEALQLAVQRCLAMRGLLLENKALRTQVELHEAGQRIASILERPKLLPQALASIASRAGGEAGALFERTQGKWGVAAAHGLDAEQAEALLAAAAPRLDRLEPDQPPVLGELDRARPRLPSPHAVLLPVLEGGELLAAVAVMEKGAFDRERVRAAELLCRHLALALRAVGRMDRAQHLAYLDDLTGLYNTRYLDLVLQREIDQRRPFSLLFLDVDRFKEVNDAHGHLVGSKMLVEVGKLLRSCARDTDVLVRYGGDEFVVVLVGADSGVAVKVAERVRRTIEGHAFLARERAPLRTTVTVGLACFPEHAETRAGILDMADRAMYRGKRSTRNVVHLASADLPPAPARG